MVFHHTENIRYLYYITIFGMAQELAFNIYKEKVDNCFPGDCLLCCHHRVPNEVALATEENNKLKAKLEAIKNIL